MRLRNVVLAAIILIAVIACQIGSTLPPPPCPIEDLLLDESVFSEEFFRGLPSKDSAPIRFGRDKIGVGFGSRTQTGGMAQDVYLGLGIRETQKEFEDWLKWEFSPREGWTEWYTPDAFDYQSSVADQYRFACYKHIASGVEDCQAIGQYGPYLIRFQATMSSILTYQVVERASQAIDAQAAQCLGQ
jgi:hypothetical protein